MIKRQFTKCLLGPDEVVPSSPEFEVAGTFNPGVVEHDGMVTLLVRVAERPVAKRAGYACSPRFVPGEGVAVDWFESDRVVFEDPRAFELKDTGHVRLTFISHLRVFHSRDGRSLEAGEVALEPEGEEEEYGLEDARITRLGETFYITYVAVSRHGACTALASTRDFVTFERHGIIFPCENKDVVLFPEKFGSDYAALHRPNPRYHFSPPAMWVAYSPDLLNWGRHSVLHAGGARWETGRIGGGAPPLRVPVGWLEIYHGNEKDPSGGVGKYVAGALLLNGANPGVVIGRTTEPIMEPEAEFERSGFLNEVVFPTGLVERGETLQVFYGAADAFTGVVEFRRDDVYAAIQPL